MKTIADELIQEQVRECIQAVLEDPTLQAIQEYVRELVQVARDDQTVPIWDPVQKRFSGWATDAFLFQIERNVLRDNNDPVAFAVICVLAGQELALIQGVAPAVPVIVALGVFNGRRRLPPTTPEFEVDGLGIIADIESLIVTLPIDTRRERCAQFFLYQQGIFLEACGRFDEAAAVQEQAAQFAEKIGDMAAAGISRFRVLVHRANQAFFTGEGTDEAVNAIIEAVPALQRAVRDTPLAVQWGIGNAYLHVLQALIWNEQAWNGDWDYFSLLFLKQAPLIEPAFGDHLALISATDKFEDEKLAELASTSKFQDVSATALLVLARLATDDDPKSARKYCARIPVAGAVRHIRAIAERELAELDI